MQDYKKFDSISCPLSGTNIIEASAGTGKTYNLQNLYARLILEKGFTVDSILVVTFTEAATKELKDRIRKILHDIQAFLDGNENVEERVKEIVRPPITGHQPPTTNHQPPVTSHQPPATKMQRISSALINFDEAAIFTIHGFCNRMLNDNSFESGILFNTELETNPAPIVQDIVEDFWRKEFYNANIFTNMLISYKKLTTRKLISFVSDFISKEDVIIEPQNIPTDNLNSIKNEFDKLVKSWNRSEIETLLINAPLSKTSYKESQIANACELIDQLAANALTKETFKAVKKFSQEEIDKNILKAFKDSPEQYPQHPFFKAASNFLNVEDQINRFDAAIKLNCRDYFNKEYAKRKSMLNIQTFDDLLNKTASQISQSDSSLLKTIRTQFNAALIDEFQDTDSIQYSIFKKIFIDANKPIFMVGDPKQAIYGFRGGDIFTYQQAKEDQAKNGNFYTLGKNWRSSPGIVKAVNALFRPNEKNPYPFVSEKIQFIEVEAEKDNDNFRINGMVDDKPFKVMIYEPENHALQASTTRELKEECYRRTAQKIYNLLSDPKFNIINKGNSRNIVPKDIAVLVATHEQARSLQPFLQKLNVPSVLQSSGSVFASREAEHLEYFLYAVAEPQNIGAVKSAMITDLMGFTADKILDSEGQQEFEIILESFKTYHEKWRDKSFIEMFNSFLAEYNVKQTLLSQINGERKLTNILHLAELLHHQEVDCKLGMNGLIHWLTEQRVNKNSITKEEHEIRLESDSDAINIMTVHKAKGLEFPIVFCPFMWSKTAETKNNSISKYHEKNNDYILDISNSENAKNKSNDEQLEELMRLLYVATTRAKYQCYLIWGNVGTKNSSALDYIFLADNSVALEPKGGKTTKLSSLAKTIKKNGLSLNLTAEQNTHIDLVAESGSVEPKFKYALNNKIKPEDVDYLRFPAGLIDQNWRITSFSSLTPHASATDLTIQKDHDETDNVIADEHQTTDDSAVNIYTFPPGARTGTCWHEIFEELDFTADGKEIQKLVNDKLAVYNLDSGGNKELQKVVSNMVKNVLTTELPNSGISLNQISNADRLSEMEFDFALNNGFNTTDISKCISEFAKKFGFKNGIPKWKQIISGGFMTGFIDLIFRYNDKYYIVDWKSNKIDGIPGGFNTNGIRSEMAKHYYFLQYLIYTVALDKYLSYRIKDYDYDKHFGGIYYIFLRGVDNNRSSTRGIFHNRPEEALIKGLAKALGGSNAKTWTGWVSPSVSSLSV